MTDDQHRIGQRTKAELLIADALERQTADPRDPAQVAAWLVEQLQGYGWTPPRDLAEKPPLRPDRPADRDGPGRAEFRQALAALGTRPRT